MPSLKYLVAGAFLSAAIAALNAQTVTVSVAQNAAAPGSATAMSKTVEDELLGTMFDRGYIVSTTALAEKDDGFETPNYGVKEAAFGLSDYLIAIRVRYGTQEMTNPDKNTAFAQILSLDWKLVRVANPAVLASGSIIPERATVLDQDPYADARRLIDGAYPAIEKALGEAKKGGSR